MTCSECGVECPPGRTGKPRRTCSPECSEKRQVRMYGELFAPGAIPAPKFCLSCAQWVEPDEGDDE